MIKNFTIYGERCSGTNFLEAIFAGKSFFHDNSKKYIKDFYPQAEAAFNIPLSTEFGHKHFFGFNDKEIIQNGDETLFIGIVRNPYDWFESLFNKRHHIPYDNWKPNNFLFNEWTVDENTLDQEISDNNFITGNRYKNIFELRKTKLEYLHNRMPEIAKNYILIRYEDLCSNQSLVINEISKRFDIDIINQNYVQPKTTPSYNLLQEYKEDITINIDWDVERLVSYNPKFNSHDQTIMMGYDFNGPNMGYDITSRPIHIEPKPIKVDQINNMEEFYKHNTLDPNFDHKLYTESYPETKDFYAPYCKRNNVDEAHRLFFHYKMYYGNAAKNDIKDLVNRSSFIKDAAILYSRDIEQILPVDEMFIESYNERTELGKEIAKDSKIAIVSLARDCGDLSLEDSINRVKSLCTNQTSFFVYENDSKDGTKDILKNNNIECISHNLNLESLQDRSYTRTERLANYRNVCSEWVRDNHSDADYVIILDLDADLGFSVDGIYNSIYWLNAIENAGGMGSYSLCHNNNYVHYDSFAIRMNDWKPSNESDHNNRWVRNWHPLVGSNPVQMYSCFGGLGVYKTDAFLGSKYKGELGSEHVDFHKTMQENGWDMYLNPSSRFFSVFNK